MDLAAHLILASASPRRRELLEQLGVRVAVRAVDIDESMRQDETVMTYVQRLAMEKALTGFDTIENPNKLPVLGSDTIIELKGDILGKPADRLEAKKMLQLLSGEKHTVHTAVAIVIDDERFTATSSSQVSFKVLEEHEIDNYLMTGEADDKAGSYAIQGIAAQFVKNLHGSYSGVMGLPLYETTQLLKRCGIEPLNDGVNKNKNSEK